MSANTTYQCEAWLREDNEEIDQSLPAEAIFLIQIYAQVMEGDTILKEFQIKRDYLLHNTASWSTISTILSEMNIPLNAHPVLMAKIMDCAEECRYLDDRKIIPMVVQLKITVLAIYDSNSTVSDAFMESFNSQRLVFVGASKAAIEVLEKVIIQDFWTQCVICLEDLPVGVEATCMPCKHIYHGSCITNWLENSNCCPLCRCTLLS